jgi:hypothetical protein
VVGLDVVDGEFRAGGDVGSRVELHSSVGDPHEDVGFAGMVDIAEGTSVDVAIDCAPVVEFDDGDPFTLFGAASRFAHADGLAGELAKLRPGAHRAIGEHPVPLNSTFSNDQHETFCDDMGVPCLGVHTVIAKASNVDQQKFGRAGEKASPVEPSWPFVEPNQQDWRMIGVALMYAPLLSTSMIVTLSKSGKKLKLVLM